RVRLFDLDHARAEALAHRAEERHGLRAEATRDLPGAIRMSDVCVTCTTARRAFVEGKDVAPGSFIAAVGADSQGKQEIEPALVAYSTLVVDVLEQCAEIGELQHALAAGLLTREQVHAEVADVIVRRRPGRRRADETKTFDGTRAALQDVDAATGFGEQAGEDG